MGLGRAHLGDWTIRSRGRVHPICRARVIRSRRYRIGATLRPVAESAERHGVPRVVAVIATATVALLILLAIVGLLSTPLAYWIGRTAELACTWRFAPQRLQPVRPSALGH
jgi:hypothetical protein